MSINVREGDVYEEIDGKKYAGRYRANKEGQLTVSEHSVALIHPMISPVVRAKPLLMASYIPSSGSLIHPAICFSYLRITSSVPSVEPPSTMK